MNIVILSGLIAILIIIIFLILHILFKELYGQFRIHFKKRVEIEHYLPEEEVKNQKRLFYLVIILICIIFLFYLLEGHGFLYLVLSSFGIELNLGKMFFSYDISYFIFEITEVLFALFLSKNLDLKKNRKDIVLFLLLVPYGSLDTILYIFSNIPTLVIFLDLIHMIAYICFIRIYYKKFMENSRNETFGRTILLFFVLLVLTVIVTIITERVNILNAANMVTNAFVSNGFNVMGTSVLGKLNEMAIVWGGYILSGLTTASLTAAIIVRHFNYKFEEYDDMNERFDELEEIVKNKKKNNAMNNPNKKE